jgi:hypothetical protein
MSAAAAAVGNLCHGTRTPDEDNRSAQSYSQLGSQPEDGEFEMEWELLESDTNAQPAPSAAEVGGRTVKARQSKVTTSGLDQQALHASKKQDHTLSAPPAGTASPEAPAPVPASPNTSTHDRHAACEMCAAHAKLSDALGFANEHALRCSKCSALKRDPAVTKAFKPPPLLACGHAPAQQPREEQAPTLECGAQCPLSVDLECDPGVDAFECNACVRRRRARPHAVAAGGVPEDVMQVRALRS